jgi:hypothetical protein
VHDTNLLSLDLFCRKESSFNLGSAETKLLYTLHWILMDAADECALAMGNEGKLETSPFAYQFPISAITVRPPSTNFSHRL